MRRMARHLGAAFGIVVLSLLIGIWGYHHFEHLNTLDAFLNAAMLLGGMGPVESPQSDGGKLFAGFFALYAGLVFLVVAGLGLAPIVHRILHKFHFKAD
jgi:hypothetical protein